MIIFFLEAAAVCLVVAFICERNDRREIEARERSVARYEEEPWHETARRTRAV